MAVALLLRACSDAEEQRLELLADDECHLDRPRVPGSDRPAEDSAAACALQALQRRSRAEVATGLALAGDPPERELSPAEVEGEFERLRAEGKLDKYIPGDQLAPMTGAAVAMRSTGGFGSVLRDLLETKVDAINRKLHAVVPEEILHVSDSNTTSTMCCMGLGSWTGCWCHCELVESVQVENLTHVNSVTVTNISDVTSRVTSGPMELTISMDLKVSDLSIAGHARRAIKACGHHFGALSGGLWLEASVNGTAEMTGVMVMKDDRMCFQCKSVNLHIRPEDVIFQREKISIGTWNVLNLHGSFWDHVAHHLPTKSIVEDLEKQADKAIPKALGQQDLCF